MCLVSHHFVPLKSKGYFGECLYKEGTEHFVIKNNNKHEWKDMFFCLKRPLWSVYTISSTNMEYSLCKRCMNYKSIIVFNYQVLNKEIVITENNNYERVLYGHKGNFTTCVTVEKECAKLIAIFFIKTKKYQQIKVQKRSTRYRVFYLNEINLNLIHYEILGSITIDYFYVTLLFKQVKVQDRI